MIQEGIQTERGEFRLKLVRVDPREVQDVAHQEVQQGQVLPILLDYFIGQRIPVLALGLHDLVVNYQT